MNLTLKNIVGVALALIILDLLSTPFNNFIFPSIRRLNRISKKLL